MSENVAIPSLFFSILNWKMGIRPDRYFSKSPPQLTENTVVEFSMYPSLLSRCMCIKKQSLLFLDRGVFQKITSWCKDYSLYKGP